MRTLITLATAALILTACGGGDKTAGNAVRTDAKAIPAQEAPRERNAPAATYRDAQLADRIRSRSGGGAGPKVEYRDISRTPAERAQEEFRRSLDARRRH